LTTYSLSRSKWSPAVTGLVALAGVTVAVELLIRFGAINRFIVPMPSQVFASFERIIVEEHLLDRFLLTSRECLYAALLLAIVGTSVGTFLYFVPLIRRACESWVGGFAAAPIVLMYPLFLVIFGRSPATIIMMGFIAGLPPMILKTIEGLAGTPPVLISVGRSFKASRAQLFWKVHIPAALPTIFVGFRLGLIFALINIVGVEYLINFGGLGQLINDLAERYDLPGTYATILFVVLVSVMFFFVTERIERWLRPTS
jgi:ABC-type nitrate/sulfonate/bicarbonate transport system permease component